MRNKLLKLVMLFSIVASFFAFESNSFAATIGKSLNAPEAGWQRYDDTSSAIKYVGTWSVATDNPLTYQVTMHENNTIGDTAIFRFKGSEIRLIATSRDNRSKNIRVSIDGNTESFSEYSSSSVAQALVYEKTQLDNAFHTVELKSTDTSWLMLDAIDINSDGYLINVEGVPNLNAVAGNSDVNLTWDNVDGAASYSIDRSLTPFGPYYEVGTSSTPDFTDNSVSNGTAYYYIISTKTSSGENVSSNEAAVTPTEPPLAGRALLTITMTTGLEKEYDLSMAEVNNFIDWYDARASGIGPAKYSFIKTWNKGPFKARTEYVIFDKILSFDVDEYDVAAS